MVGRRQIEHLKVVHEQILADERLQRPDEVGAQLCTYLICNVRYEVIA